MALTIKHTRELIDPAKLRLKILIYGLPGTGKTTFMSTAPDLGAGICETGYGRGSLSAAAKDYEYVELNSYADLDSFCSSAVFKEKNSVGLDSLSWATRTIIKDKALSIPRQKGESQKRQLGIPELDDYGTIGELTRKLVNKLLQTDQHLIVTSGLRIDKPDPENGQGEMLVGPDLAGQMFLGSTAMFDLVLCTRTRSVLRDPKDAKSRYTQYIYLTNSPGNGIIAKNRLTIDGLPFLPQEVVFNKDTGEGDFNWILKRAQDAYSNFLAKKAS